MKSRKTIALVSVLMMMILIFAGCASSGNQGSSDQSDKNNSNTGKGEVSGTVTAVGSTAMQPLVEKAAAAFMDLHPNVTINVQGGGSGTGLSQVSEGGSDIGNSDVVANEKIKDEAKAKALVDHSIIAQGFAAIVNKDIKLDSLTKEQIKGIFTGKYKNWKEIGGQDLPIVVVNRPASSGTRATFVDKLLDGAQLVEGNTLTQDSNGTVLNTVANTAGAISYLGLAYLNDTVKPIAIDGVKPSVENIIAGKYPVWSFGHMYTNGEPTGAVKAFLEYMQSDEVAAIAKQMNYIGGSDAAKMSK